MTVVILEDAAEDLESGIEFYESCARGVGDYFLDSIYLFRRGFQFPQNIHDHPAAVRLGDVQIIDPIRRYHFDAGCVLKHIKNGDILLLFFFWRVLSATSFGSLDETHRAHLIQAAAALRI